MQRFFRTRLGAFVLFLIVAILPDLLIGGTAYLLLRFHVIQQPEMTWRPTLFLLFEGTTILGLLMAIFVVIKLGGRSLRDLGFAARNAGSLLLAGSAAGIAAPMLLIAVIAALGGLPLG